jgi:PLP dependent protein
VSTDDESARRAELSAGLGEVRSRIDAACEAAGRTDEVRLVVVTKTFPATDVSLLADLGVADVGENRDQEAKAKRELVDARRPISPLPRWHMIGQLQRNKARSVAAWADVVESVDRLSLVAALGRAAVEAERPLEVLLQVNLDPDPAPGRGGALPEEIPALGDAVAAEQGLRLAGVMGVAPNPGAGDPGPSALAAFVRLAALSERLREAHPEAVEISAGMSGDLEEAIRAGATQVRVGGAILGPRPPVQ